MQRVRKFLIVKENRTFSNRLKPSVLSAAVQCEGWHQSWDTAIRLKESRHSVSTEDAGEVFPEVAEVAIVDESSSLVIAIFSSQRNLECLDPPDKVTKWKSARVSTGEGCWCNLNYSDYGWGWVSGAEREVPFRLRFFERQAEANPTGLLNLARAWIMEARDWIYGHGKKIG